MFHQKLLETMQKYNITQAELSKRTGMSQPLISGYMSGKYEPKADKLSKVAKALGVTESYLMGTDNDEGMTVLNDERELLKTFRELSDFHKGLVLGEAKAFNLTKEREILIQKVQSLSDEEADLFMRVFNLPIEKLKALNNLLENIQ